jgi:tRNA threonylcarbamoyladenosine biosynthesis protein TsaE
MGNGSDSLLPATSTLSVETHSVEESVALGRALGGLLQPGDVVALVGPLGAGKTYFAKGVAAGLGVADTAKVVSPSFVLVREYEGRAGPQSGRPRGGRPVGIRLRHVDAYRLHHPRELTELGAEELFDEAAVTVVEWADRFPEGTIPAVLEVRLSHLGPTAREVRFSALGERGVELVSALRRTQAGERPLTSGGDER